MLSVICELKGRHSTTRSQRSATAQEEVGARCVGSGECEGCRTSVDDVGERHLDAGVINQGLSRLVFQMLLRDKQRVRNAPLLSLHHARLPK